MFEIIRQLLENNEKIMTVKPVVTLIEIGKDFLANGNICDRERKRVIVMRTVNGVRWTFLVIKGDSQDSPDFGGLV
jgi:hypothetical protein